MQTTKSLQALAMFANSNLAFDFRFQRTLHDLIFQTREKKKKKEGKKEEEQLLLLKNNMLKKPKQV